MTANPRAGFDAVHAAVMLNNDVEWIATFDAGFDEIPGIRRMKLSYCAQSQRVRSMPNFFSSSA